eukprot:Rhum_TRINITY_DN200_c0_g1::Rhum_TRINITY_DN200_c0_g1_i1::g.716::m.716
MNGGLRSTWRTLVFQRRCRNVAPTLTEAKPQTALSGRALSDVAAAAVLKGVEERVIDSSRPLKGQERKVVARLYTEWANLHARHSFLNTQSYNAFIKVLSRMGPQFVGLAEEKVEEMAAKRVYPDQGTYTAMMTLYAKTMFADADGREETFRKLVGVWQEMKRDGMRPDTRCYNALLRSTLAQGHPERVAELGKAMLRDGVAKNEHTYAALLCAAPLAAHERAKGMAAQEVTRRTKAAVDRVFETMLEERVRPNSPMLGGLVGALGKVGEVRLAEGVLDRAEHLGVQPDIRVYNTLLSVLRAHGLWGRSLKLLNAIDCRFSTHTYTMTIRSCAQLTQEEGDRYSKFAQALTEAALRDGLFTPHTLLAMLDVYRKQGALDRALALYRGQIDIPSRYMPIVLSQLHSMYIDRGADVPEDMRRIMAAHGVE